MEEKQEKQSYCRYKIYFSGGGSKKKYAQKAVPFLQIMKELTDHQRSILLDHLDLPSKAILFDAVANVVLNEDIVKSGGKRRRLKSVLSPHRNDLRAMCNSSTISKNKASIMQNVGGHALSYIIDAALNSLLIAC